MAAGHATGNSLDASSRSHFADRRRRLMRLFRFGRLGGMETASLDAVKAAIDVCEQALAGVALFNCRRASDVGTDAWSDSNGICFSTAHKARGLEFEQVWLADDFMRYFEDRRELGPDQAEQQAVNILYVALTRVRAVIRLSESFDGWLRHRRMLPT